MAVLAALEAPEDGDPWDFPVPERRLPLAGLVLAVRLDDVAVGCVVVFSMAEGSCRTWNWYSDQTDQALAYGLLVTTRTMAEGPLSRAVCGVGFSISFTREPAGVSTALSILISKFHDTSHARSRSSGPPRSGRVGERSEESVASVKRRGTTRGSWCTRPRSHVGSRGRQVCSRSSVERGSWGRRGRR